jgi:hypothetical protein
MLHPTLLLVSGRRDNQTLELSPLGQSIWDAFWHCQEGSANAALDAA